MQLQKPLLHSNTNTMHAVTAQKLPITDVKINDYLWTCSTLLPIKYHQRAVAAAFQHHQTINLYFNGSWFHLSCVPPLNLEQDLWG